LRLAITSSTLAVLLATVAAAQPTIRSTPDGVVNNASYSPRGLPNSSIAQGSIFAVFGSNMGGASLAQQPSYPLQKTLAGTAVKVTVGGTSVDAIPIYTVATQVGVVLPSNTPTGDGTVTVTYNGQNSASHAITVVPSSFGTFSLNQQGSGPGVVTDANYAAFTLTNSAKPGQPIIIWGTGLGPITGDDAATPNPKNLTGIPVQVYIGGQLATAQYQGRSGCCAGLDQVIVTVPQGVSGCYVSLILVTNNSVPSNATTLPVAANGGTCSDTNGLSSSDLNAYINNPTGLKLGGVSVGRSLSTSAGVTVPGVGTIGGGTTKSDEASAYFVKYTPLQLVESKGLFQQASIGSCIVTTFSGNSSQVVDPVLPVYLDAGATINLTGGTTPQTLTRNAQYGFYSIPTPSGATTTPTFIPDAGGTFTFNNGSGGADVGSLQNATIALGAPIVWTNMAQITDVTRTNDLPITWTGGNPGTYVQISGSSISLGADSSSTVVVIFSCTAPVAALQFTVPRAVLLQLPASSSVSSGGVSIPVPGSLAVGNYANPVKFTATGLDVGYASAYVTNSTSVNYK
jgi:uncharacterized protein (TIGR03437 family)